MKKSYARVEAEIAQGRYWRAKQILSGRLAQSHYDVEFFRRYAAVLQAMKDEDEAGRFYFLSGATDGESAALARAFLSRRQGTDLARLWSSMPKAARVVTSDDPVPESVAQCLIEAGHSRPSIDALYERFDKKRSNKLPRPNSPSHAPSRLWSALGWLFAALILCTFLLGALSLGEIIRSAVVRLV